ncbi:di-heme oxidoredictase family protein [Aquimarina spongiae]|uniref:Family 31 carbohydrate binding protein n=1 Tax=Aquimarina spongiae TaxID=570521 RepID=A0A1M6F0N6_9FLAO|nr:di-heme oxidoredictase family protein [Aquimarina spongiae]SHI91247.1 Family 31 carbohydrate binding protein [Aquimarina spongiae]
MRHKTQTKSSTRRKGKLPYRRLELKPLFILICIHVFTFGSLFSQTNNTNSGIEVDGGIATLYFENQPEWTDNFNFLCLNDACVSGTLNAATNRWERQVNATAGQTYQIQIKISSSVDGQYISDQITVTAQQAGNNDPDPDPQPSCNDGIQNQGETDVDCGGPCAPCDAPNPNPNPGGETVIQAESGSLLGSAQYYNDGAATNGQGVAYISSVGAGFALQNVPSASSVQLKYASQQSGTLSIFVNGNDAGNISFSSNGSWVGNYTTATIEVNVPQRATFEIIYQSGDAAMNVDELTFIGQGQDPDPTCDDGILNNGETEIDCGGPNCDPCDNPPPPVTGPVIALTSNSEKGTFLVGGQDANQPGFSLYTFDNDNDSLPFSDCYNGCETTWPPVTVQNSQDLIITNQVNNTFTNGFGLSARCDGSLQVTYDNKPLYYFANDNAAGDTNGDNVNGVWHLVTNQTDPEPTCNDGILNNGETEIDCGGPNCDPCTTNPPIDGGTCGDYGLTIVDGQGVIYSREDLGQVLYMCTGPEFNGCVAPDKLENGYYQRAINITVGETYELGIQGGPNTTFTVAAGEDRCYFVATCSDGVQNGKETGIDCGGPDCDVCPTCDDGIQNGDEEGVDCGGSNCTIGCDEVCNGTPNPNAVVSVTNETVENENDGTIQFTFDNVASRDNLEFSINNGSSYPYATPDNAGSFTVDNLSPATYNIWVRWGNNECPIFLGEFVILEGGPAPTCNDGILNQGEERVDCGGPNCGPCPDDPCGEIALVNYPRPALPTPIIGSDAAQGFAFDLANDLSTVSVRVGPVVQIQSGGNPDFEFHCSCNQVTFNSVRVNGTVAVPEACRNAGDFYYFFRYKKQGNTTNDPGDIYVYSGLFTTAGQRIDPDNRPTITREGANWMRFRHPHAQDGITEAVFDAQHNSDLLRNMDRYNTIFTDAASGLIIDPRLTRGDANSVHPHGNVDNAEVVRIDYMEKGDSSPPTYAKSAGQDAGKWGYGNIVTYEITAVTGGSGAQTYNTFQNYVVGEGLNTLGDPRLSLAGRASTYMVLPGFGSHVDLEADAIFTQHIITLTSEDDVDDFLEGHHLFHGVRHRRNGNDPGNILGEINIGSTNCQECHFRDGRGSKLERTRDGDMRVPPPVYGVGILQYIAGAQAKLAWKGDVPTVEQQVKNALINDHGIDPETDISSKDLRQLVAYTEFLTVPTRSPGAYDIPGVEEGDKTFHRIGCTSCHSPTQITSSSAPAEFRNLTIRPYTDMKLHTVTDEPYRTPPLWGLGRNIDLLERNGKALILMHDGRATTLDGAIQAHGGEANGSRAAYNNLSQQQKDNLIKFLKTL